jgi:hypothetical protein
MLVRAAHAGLKVPEYALNRVRVNVAIDVQASGVVDDPVI